MSPTREGRALPRADRLVVGAFVASGAAGLMYQVVWSRQLVLVFGNTTESIGTIVTAFMAGLGLGGLVGGLLSSRLRRPLLWYGLAEIAVGGSALLVPAGFAMIAGAYRTAYDTGSGDELTLVRLALTMATVTPVTFLMGLTLPLLTRHLVSSMRTAGARMGQLYSANTLGAVAGTLLAGLVLIELLGLSATAQVGVGLNLLAGLIGVGVSYRRPAPGRAPAAPEPGARAEPVDLYPGLRPLLYVATFVSGFVALAVEVLWTRMLAEGTGSRIYNFVAILAVYLVGIGLGGAVYRLASNRRRDTPQALALGLLGVAASTLVTVPLGTMWLGSHYLARALIMLPATLCMGYTFPLSARLLTSAPGHGARSIGLLYSCNTVGSILGSLTAAFVLAGSLGTNASILILGGGDAAVGLALLMASVRGPLQAPSLPTSLMAAAQVALILMPPPLVFSNSPLLRTTTEHHLDAHHRMYHHVEDRLSTVDAVGGPRQDLRLYVSGTAMTQLSVDTKLMAYLPRLIRPHSSRFLDVAFGMGTTYRSALNLGYRTDAVDLSPSVPKQMGTFYPDANRYLHNPRGRIIIADGRNYVRLTQQKYDVISVDPPPPIQAAGAVVLYTREFYAAAHARLNPGGLMLQWLYFGVTLKELREHLHTFRSEFRHVLVMMSPMHGGIYMLGSDSPIGWSSRDVTRVLGSTAATRDISDAPDSIRLAGRPWPSLLAHSRWLRDGNVDRFAGRAPLITDDHPLTEYYLLHHLFMSQDNRDVTEARLRALWP